MVGVGVGVAVGVAVALAAIALVLIVVGPSRAVRAETGMDQDAETRVMLRYYPEGSAEPADGAATETSPSSPVMPSTFDTAEIRALRDLDEPTAAD